MSDTSSASPTGGAAPDGSGSAGTPGPILHDPAAPGPVTPIQHDPVTPIQHDPVSPILPDPGPVARDPGPVAPILHDPVGPGLPDPGPVPRDPGQAYPMGAPPPMHGPDNGPGAFNPMGAPPPMHGPDNGRGAFNPMATPSPSPSSPTPPSSSPGGPPAGPGGGSGAGLSQGMDVSRARHIAASLDHSARAIDEALTRAQAAVRTLGTDWRGQDAAAFEREWTSVRSSIQQDLTAVKQMATLTRTNAAAQEGTSAH